MNNTEAPRVMMDMRRTPRRGRFRRMLSVAVLLVAAAFASVAWAGPRSGASFGSRSGFRTGSGSYSSPSRSYGSYGSSSYGYSGGSHFGFWPSFGWGWGGFGFGSGLGSLLVLGVVGFVALNAFRAARRRASDGGMGADDDLPTGRAYVYKLQLAYGRSARGLQDRLDRFASSGDTNSTAGLSSLVQQTALELLREKDSVKYAAVDGAGPMNLNKAEEKLNELALQERSHFQVERVRASDGQVRRDQTAAVEGREALELVVVTLVLATRTPLDGFETIASRTDVEASLRSLGRVSAQSILGLEVVWTPADPNDSMTEMDVMAAYPELRGV